MHKKSRWNVCWNVRTALECFRWKLASLRAYCFEKIGAYCSAILIFGRRISLNSVAARTCR
jgi:hypothetical protein